MKYLAIVLFFVGGWCSAGRASVVEMTAQPLWGHKSGVGEPVLVRVTVRNPTAKMRGINMSDGYFPDGIYLAVYDDKSRLLSSPPPTGSGGGLSSGHRVGAGKSLSQTYLATAWHRFDREGSYSIRVQLLGDRAGTPFRAPLRVLAQHTIRIAVGPMNTARLGAKCRELFAWAHPWSKEGRDIRQRFRLQNREQPMPDIVAARALLSVRDEVAAPFFARLVQADHYSTGACLALRRLRTQQAATIVAKFAERRDTIGKAARQALKMSLNEEQMTYTEQQICD